MTVGAKGTPFLQSLAWASSEDHDRLCAVSYPGTNLECDG